MFIDFDCGSGFPTSTGSGILDLSKDEIDSTTGGAPAAYMGHQEY